MLGALGKMWQSTCATGIALAQSSRWIATNSTDPSARISPDLPVVDMAQQLWLTDIRRTLREPRHKGQERLAPPATARLVYEPTTCLGDAAMRSVATQPILAASNLGVALLLLSRVPCTRPNQVLAPMLVFAAINVAHKISIDRDSLEAYNLPSMDAFAKAAATAMELRCVQFAEQDIDQAIQQSDDTYLFPLVESTTNRQYCPDMGWPEMLLLRAIDFDVSLPKTQVAHWRTVALKKPKRSKGTVTAQAYDLCLAQWIAYFVCACSGPANLWGRDPVVLSDHASDTTM